MLGKNFTVKNGHWRRLYTFNKLVFLFFGYILAYFKKKTKKKHTYKNSRGILF